MEMLTFLLAFQGVTITLSGDCGLKRKQAGIASGDDK